MPPKLKEAAPRAKFCWHCGKMLYQRKVHEEKIIDGWPRILHKACAKDIERTEQYYEWGDEEE